MISVFMKFTPRAATSFSVLEEPRTSINGLSSGLSRGGQKHSSWGIYRSSIIWINYVQYKPFIQIKL